MYNLTDENGEFVRDTLGNLISTGVPKSKASEMSDQLHWYLDVCKKSYERLCPENGDITLTKDYVNMVLGTYTIDKHIESNEIIDDYLIEDSTAFISNTTLRIVVDDYNKKYNTNEKWKDFRDRLVSSNQKVVSCPTTRTDFNIIEQKNGRGYIGYRLKPGMKVSVTTNSIVRKNDED